MAKLWQKQYDLDSLVEEFTVGKDYELDRDLVAADCLGSIAQARMLRKIGLLNEEECEALVLELRAIAREGVEGVFEIRREDEDCHTAIENRLTDKLGESGKKIHTGRSRNDQVLTALRLYERSFLVELALTAAPISLRVSAAWAMTSQSPSRKAWISIATCHPPSERCSSVVFQGKRAFRRGSTRNLGSLVFLDSASR